MATGVLPLLLGRAARAAALLPETEKEYRRGLRAGRRAPTRSDRTGQRDRSGRARAFRNAEAAGRPCCRAFAADILQIPPMYSADPAATARRLYELAREGLVVEREAAARARWTRLELTVVRRGTAGGGRCSVSLLQGDVRPRTLICGSGGARAGTLGTMTALCGARRACGFSLADAVPLDDGARSGGIGRRSSALVRPGGGPVPRIPAAGGGERVRRLCALCQRRRARCRRAPSLRGTALGRAWGTAAAYYGPGRRVPRAWRRTAGGALRRAAAVLRPPRGSGSAEERGTRRMKLYQDLHPAGARDGRGPRRVRRPASWATGASSAAAIGRGRVAPAVFTFETDILREGGKGAPVLLLAQDRKVGAARRSWAWSCAGPMPFCRSSGRWRRRDFAREVLAGVCRATTGVLRLQLPLRNRWRPRLGAGSGRGVRARSWASRVTCAGPRRWRRAGRPVSSTRIRDR